MVARSVIGRRASVLGDRVPRGVSEASPPPTQPTALAAVYGAPVVLVHTPLHCTQWMQRWCRCLPSANVLVKLQ